MTDKLKTAFDGICAEENLKSNTTQFLQKEIQKQNKAKELAIFKKYTVAIASAIAIFLSGAFTYDVYFTPAAYVDVDINPSIELALNRFDRVIGSHAYNDDGEEIIKGLSMKHKSYDDALVVLMEAMTEQAYFQDDGLVSVTLQTDNKNKETVLLTNIQTGIESYLTVHNHTMQLDVFLISSDTRSHSDEFGISPAKYLAIQELIAVDPIASIESRRGHSISEIRKLTQEHGNHHGNGNPDDGNETSIDDNDSYNNGNDDCDDDVQGSDNINGNHGENNDSGHHGSGH